MNTPKNTLKNLSKPQRVMISITLGLVSLGLAYAPIPGLKSTIVVVSGTEFQEPLEKLEKTFEEKYPNINLELKFQGSQDIVNNFIDGKNDFKPTLLIPSSEDFLEELKQRWQAQNQSDPFYDQPQPIAKTMLVGIAWPERGKVLFPRGHFEWDKIEQAMTRGNWQKIGGEKDWGSFDFVMTDPTRSNSGQVTLSLWTQAKLKGNLNLNDPSVENLFKTVKQSVYLPPRSTDILLQEFITRGPNDADAAAVYESIALNRWQQAQASKGQPYQIYYLDPTIETVATAAIVRQEVGNGQKKAAEQFRDFLREPQQQQIFVQYGFRPVINGINLESVPNSPWSQNIPGAEVNPSVKVLEPPNPQTLGEIQKLWNRVN